MRKYYILPVYGCTDPEPLIGPFKTFNAMLRRVRKIRSKQRDEDSIFWLRMEEGKRPMVFPFTNGDLE